MERVSLGRGVVFEVHPDRRLVATVFPDGRVAGATREDTPENRAEAADQGYTGPDAVWRSLVEHEALHTILGRVIWGRESLVLRHESGAEPASYAHRLYEEAVVISFQRWLNLGVRDPVIAQLDNIAREARYGR